MFDRTIVLNLDRRKDRWEEFCRRSDTVDWDAIADICPRPERVSAVDGSRDRSRPRWYRCSPGNWGDVRSHVEAIQAAIRDGIGSLLIFEDDALFCEDFAGRLRKFSEVVPSDWDQVYLGGQHLQQIRQSPVSVGLGVVKCHNVNRTHAHAIRGPAMIDVLKILTTMKLNLPVDHQLGRHHQHQNVYAPTEWLVAQAAGQSDITNDYLPPRAWGDFTEAIPLLGDCDESSGNDPCTETTWSDACSDTGMGGDGREDICEDTDGTGTSDDD